MTAKSAINGLLEAAKQESEKIQSVKSVAEAPNQPAKPEQEPGESPAKVTEPAQEAMSSPEGGTGTASLEQLLKKREEKDNEIVRIPRSVHKELKILSSVTGIPIGHLVGNLIEAELKLHEKEITALKKKYIKGL